MCAKADTLLRRGRLDWYRARIQQAVHAVKELYPAAAISWVTAHYRECFDIGPLLKNRLCNPDSNWERTV